MIATHDGGWRDDSGFEEQKLNLGLRSPHRRRAMGLDLAATNLDQETAGFIQGFRTPIADEAIAKSNPNPEAYRDAYAIRLTGDYERPLSESVALEVRPYVRHSRMDFLQHFLVGKPLEENGQDSLGVLDVARASTAFRTRSSRRPRPRVADGFLKETQAGPRPTAHRPRMRSAPRASTTTTKCDSSVAAVYGQIEQPFARALDG